MELNSLSHFDGLEFLCSVIAPQVEGEPPDGMTIEPWTVERSDQVKAVFAACFGDAGLYVKTVTEKIFAPDLSLVLMANGQVIGFVLCQVPFPHTVYIVFTGILPARRGGLLAKVVLPHLINLLHQKGYNFLFGAIDKDKKDLIQYAWHLGFSNFNLPGQNANKC